MTHRVWVTGVEPWEQAKFQLDFLKSKGLLPGHRLLELACGCFRGAQYFVPYLSQGNYFGFDNEPDILQSGIDNELTPEMKAKGMTYAVVQDFEMDNFAPGAFFDFAWAYSMFTHIGPEAIQKCLAKVCARLAPGGVFYATYDVSPYNREILREKHPRWNHYTVTYYPTWMLADFGARAGFKSSQWVSGPICPFYDNAPTHHNIMEFRKAV
jgi:cyclopropane fatty-acyl-phospholipid synthase-like methyltransferase